jgi:hypothetical protein
LIDLVRGEADARDAERGERDQRPVVARRGWDPDRQLGETLVRGIGHAVPVAVVGGEVGNAGDHLLAAGDRRGGRVADQEALGRREPSCLGQVAVPGQVEIRAVQRFWIGRTESDLQQVRAEARRLMSKGISEPANV